MMQVASIKSSLGEVVNAVEMIEKAIRADQPGPPSPRCRVIHRGEEGL
jgi:hypothetical protein